MRLLVRDIGKMNIFVLTLLLMVMLPFGRSCKDGNKSKYEKSVYIKNNNVGQEGNKNKNTFSVSVLKGTKWGADYSDSDREYRITFSDTTYVTSISFIKSERVYNNVYPFYLSDTITKSFDKVKVGKNTKGNYLIFYNENNKRKPVNYAKLSWGMPSQLIMIREGRDTVIFKRCN